MSLRDLLSTLPASEQVYLAYKGEAIPYPILVASLLDQKIIDLDDPGYSISEIVTEEETPGEYPDLQPLNLRELLEGDPPIEEWLVEPVIPKGKLIGIVSKRGQGKSLLTLDIAYRLATGQECLHQKPADPISIIYLDMEMSPADVYNRLWGYGYSPTSEQKELLYRNLHYYQLVNIPPLNTEAGGNALEYLVDRHQAELVAIDTLSRVVSGEENAAEPYKDLFRHTETRLKRRGITLLRLDHLGKDSERGSRGSSAKEDPLDVVWSLKESATGNQITLRAIKRRQEWIPREITILKDEHNGITTHTAPVEYAEPWLLAIVNNLDLYAVPLHASYREAMTTLREHEVGAQAQRVRDAMKFRQNRGIIPLPKQPVEKPVENVGVQGELTQNLEKLEESGDSPAGLTLDPQLGRTGTQNEETTKGQVSGVEGGTQGRDAGVYASPNTPPSKGGVFGTHPNPRKEQMFDDDGGFDDFDELPDPF